MKTAYHFFLANAGYSYNPKTQTPQQGRAECAKHLASAEQRAKEAGCFFRWTPDYEVTSADWINADEDGGANRSPWHTWQCDARDGNGKVFASLGGIDFGRDGEPYGQAYKRVVEAELACELP